MKFEFHPDALLEYEDAVSFYEDRQAGLGNRFILAVEHAFNTIREVPERWPFLEEDVRRRLTSVFPYAVLYTVETLICSSSPSCTVAGNQATGASGARPNRHFRTQQTLTTIRPGTLVPTCGPA